MPLPGQRLGSPLRFVSGGLLRAEWAPAGDGPRFAAGFRAPVAAVGQSAAYGNAFSHEGEAHAARSAHMQNPEAGHVLSRSLLERLMARFSVEEALCVSLPSFLRFSTRSNPAPLKCCQCAARMPGPSLGQVPGPSLTTFHHRRERFGRISAESGPSSNVRPKWAKFGEVRPNQTNVGQIWAKVGQAWSDVGRNSSNKMARIDKMRTRIG